MSGCFSETQCKCNCVDHVNRGLVTISIMRRLEELSQCRIYELFDYVCGVSTGSLIGAMAAIFRVPVAEMEEIYKEFSVQMFERNRLVGAGKLFTAHAYYDTDLWERILRYCLLMLSVDCVAWQRKSKVKLQICLALYYDIHLEVAPVWHVLTKDHKFYLPPPPIIHKWNEP